MKRFLSFIFAICMIVPAMATPSHTSATFPNDELMLEDYTYQNQAIYPNTGVYSGSVTVMADYVWTDVNVTTGNYLPSGATATTGCTAGNFCPGLQDPAHYDAENDQGITACSTLGDNSYTLSVANATSETDCYKACATSMVSHATTVTGNDYYGAGTDTCTATACESGWSVSNGACVANTINITWIGASQADIDANNAGQCTYGGDINTPVAYTGTVPTGQHFVGWKFTYDFSTLPTNEHAISSFGKGSRNRCVTVINNNQKTEGSCSTYSAYSEYENLNENEWMANYSWGTLYGEAFCSDTAGGSMGASGNPESSPGNTECWCRATGYTPAGQSKKFPPTSVGWVYDSSTISSEGNPMCNIVCAGRCGAHQTSYVASLALLRGLIRSVNQ